MKTTMRTIASAESFATLPKDYTGLCQRYVPRPLHDAADYAAARQAIEPLLGFPRAIPRNPASCSQED
jgi:hypothetical protein